MYNITYADAIIHAHKSCNINTRKGDYKILITFIYMHSYISGNKVSWWAFSINNHNSACAFVCVLPRKKSYDTKVCV